MSPLDAYDYELPPELIAQQPIEPRDAARLLVLRRADHSLTHARATDLPSLLDPGDCLVVNETRVVPARLMGYRTATGGRWEGLFLDALADGSWRMLSKTRGRLQSGETITLEPPTDAESLVDAGSKGDAETVEVELLERQAGGVWRARPRVAAGTQLIDLLTRLGRVPLPGYIRGGQMSAEDREDYQTIFAREPGAVAAPTAGLHFTPRVLEDLARREIALHRVVLHVGLGTFRPIEADSLDGHTMHAETGRIEAATAASLNAARREGRRIVAVGTTSVRVLETAATPSGELEAWSGATDLFIRPPYQFRAIDGLMTNFHLPRSTLLVLVHTLAGDELARAAYRAAVENRYRFYSYGDAMLIL